MAIWAAALPQRMSASIAEYGSGRPAPVHARGPGDLLSQGDRQLAPGALGRSGAQARDARIYRELVVFFLMSLVYLGQHCRLDRVWL